MSILSKRSQFLPASSTQAQPNHYPLYAYIILAGSLAVLSDAAHLAADLSAFLVAIIGFHIASLPASSSYSFGLKRTESLAALFSMVCLVILSIGLAVEATHRVWIILYVGGDEFQVNGKLMSTIASIGVVVNVILAFVLGEDHAHLPVSANFWMPKLIIIWEKIVYRFRICEGDGPRPWSS